MMTEVSGLKDERKEVVIEQIEALTLSHESTIRDAIRIIDNNGLGAALVVNERRQLVGTITDGDVRIAVLNKVNLDTPAAELLKVQEALPFDAPIKATPAHSNEELVAMMRKYSIRHIPIIDEAGRPIRLAILDQLLGAQPQPMRALVSAGGLGTRLHPLTQFVPKPMVPINDKPLLEHSLNHLRKFGITDFHISVKYKKDQIIDHFGDGSHLGVSIQYIHEEQPLGTGGAVRQLPQSSCSTLVINGDILTDLNLRLFQTFHLENQADITVGVRQFEIDVPFGVVDLNGIEISRLREKPKFFYFINAGVYLLSPSVTRHFPDSNHFNMTDIIDSVIEANGKVVSFPICGYWNDVGNIQDYERVKADFERNRICF